MKATRNKVFRQLEKRIHSFIKKGDLAQAKIYQERLEKQTSKKSMVNYQGEYVLQGDEVVFKTIDNTIIYFANGSNPAFKNFLGMTSITLE